MRTVHVAHRQPPEDITQRFSKLSKLIRVVAYCRRFINNCRHSKAKKTTTLSTQDLDQALTCCVKMVQQISYTQETKDLMEQQEVAPTSSLKTIHPFIDQEGLLRVRGRIQVYSSLLSNASDDFASKSSLYKIGCLSRTHTTSSCWATTFDGITT